MSGFLKGGINQTGEILLEGKGIAEYNVKWLRSRIRIVQQEPILFRGTVFENVANGLVGSQVGLATYMRRRWSGKA